MIFTRETEIKYFKKIKKQDKKCKAKQQMAKYSNNNDEKQNCPTRIDNLHGKARQVTHLYIHICTYVH